MKKKFLGLSALALLGFSLNLQSCEKENIEGNEEIHYEKGNSDNDGNHGGSDSDGNQEVSDND